MDTKLKTAAVSLCLYLLLSFGVAELHAQNRVSGKVMGADNTALPGVTINVKGTGTGTTTDATGSYSLDVTSEDVPIFSFIGMKAQEIQVKNRSVIDVTLAEDIETLNEVIVVGYGTQN